jgi:hypothetical protein
MSTRVRFRFDYGTTFENGTREAIEKLVRKPIKFEDDGRVRSFESYDADLREVLRIVPADRIKLQEMEPDGLADLVEAVEQLGARIAAMQPAFNERVQVVVPGFALMEIRHVEVRRDYCSDALQEDLDEGWRILAICPQPDQRRPDYILGRTGAPA